MTKVPTKKLILCDNLIQNLFISKLTRRVRCGTFRAHLSITKESQMSTLNSALGNASYRNSAMLFAMSKLIAGQGDHNNIHDQLEHGTIDSGIGYILESLANETLKTAKLLEELKDMEEIEFEGCDSVSEIYSFFEHQKKAGLLRPARVKGAS